MLTDEELEQVWSYLSARKIDYQSKTIDTPTSADGANIRIPVIDLRNSARQAGNMDLSSVLSVYAGQINAVDTKADNHIDNKNNPHEVTAEQVGLGNVDNTSDEDKPISTAMQGALDDLEAKIEAVVKDKIMPVGSIYVQFKDQSEPADIFGGTWQNISNQYAAQFFRAEGNNGDHVAETFGSDVQEDKIRSIKGAISGASTTGTYLERGQGCFTFDNIKRSPDVGGFGNWNSGYYHIFDANTDNNSFGNPMAGHADGTEIRPYNSTIRIWKRTA